MPFLSPLVFTLRHILCLTDCLQGYQPIYAFRCSFVWIYSSMHKKKLRRGQFSIRAVLTRLSVCVLQMCVCVRFRCVCARVLQMCVCVCFRCVCGKLLTQRATVTPTIPSVQAVIISSPDTWDWTRIHALVVMHRRTLCENVDSAKIKVPFYRYRYFMHGIAIDASYRYIDPYRWTVTPLE